MRWTRYLALGLLLAVVIAPISADAEETRVTATIALMVKDVTVSGVTSSRARVSWVTNSAATSRVFYDTAPHDQVADYTQSTVLDDAFVFSHRVLLSGLAAGETYHFRAESTSGNLTTMSEDLSFTTKSRSQRSPKRWPFWNWFGR